MYLEGSLEHYYLITESGNLGLSHSCGVRAGHAHGEDAGEGEEFRGRARAEAEAAQRPRDEALPQVQERGGQCLEQLVCVTVFHAFLWVSSETSLMGRSTCGTCATT